VENVLLLGQVVVSFALMASILLQSRGAGLGATFGGDSSVYRSRRGIEKRLFQFTILLGILFVLFSVIAYKLSPVTTTAV
jgi:preprotein translocase subunit SecG